MPPEKYPNRHGLRYTEPEPAHTQDDPGEEAEANFALDAFEAEGPDSRFWSAEKSLTRSGEDDPLHLSLTALVDEIGQSSSETLTRIAKGTTPGFDGEIAIARALPAYCSLTACYRRTWSGIARAMAIMAPQHHDPAQDINTVLALHGIPEERVLALASAPTAIEATDWMIRIAQLLRKSRIAKPIGFDWYPVAKNLLQDDAQQPLRHTLTNYYATSGMNLVEQRPEENWELNL